MRVVIDLQGAQTESRFRGIGRYTMSLAQAIVRNRRDHEILLALNGFFPDTIEPVRAAFDGLLPQENVRVWHAVGPVRESEPNNECRRDTAELIREAFVASLRPDLVWIPSLFEGYVDDGVSSIGSFIHGIPTAVTVHDLIPLQSPQAYLDNSPAFARHYRRKIDHLKRANLWLAISQSSTAECCSVLNLPADSVINTAEGCDSIFRPLDIEEADHRDLLARLGVTRRFALCAGSADARKNLARLILAFAGLPAPMRDRHQLVLAGRMFDGEVSRLQQVARSKGLDDTSLVFTGYVTDEELVKLYNLCQVTVCPSWHEGFGLPALEAMSCAAPVIAANTTSLPEVVGLDIALFDPFDIDAISEKMARALNDETFRRELRANGLQQAKRFSWDASANRAIAGWESLMECRPQHLAYRPPTGRRPRLAFVSPMPPGRTGIADYSADLLPALAAYYDIEVVVMQSRVDGPWVSCHVKVRDEAWLRAHVRKIDRVLYQFGNSPFHQHMLPLLRDIPGTVVLDDFCMSGLLAWQELEAGMDGVWTEALYQAHGYAAVCDRYQDAENAKCRYPANLHILQYAHGVIVHAEYFRQLAERWYQPKLAVDWAVIPLPKAPPPKIDKTVARKQLRLRVNDFVVCSFGFLDSSKLNHRLLSCWLKSVLAKDARCRLVFVGQNHGGDYASKLLETMRSSPQADRIQITSYVSPEVFRQYLLAADVAVQLSSDSRGETSAATLNCLNYGLPVIVNANGSMSELNRRSVFMINDEFEDTELIAAIEKLWLDSGRRLALSQKATELIQHRHSPSECARFYMDAIERFHRQAETNTAALIKAITKQKSFSPSHIDLVRLSRAMASTLPLGTSPRCLFLDVTATCRNDLKTGIERSARALMLALFEGPPADYRIEPVFLSDQGGEWHYRHARRYTLSLLGCPHSTLEDEIVEPQAGDILLVLDMSGDSLIEAGRSGLFMNYRNQGVKAYSIVFDLLPVHMPEVFPPGADESHRQWLAMVLNLNGALCISRTTAEGLDAWRRATLYSDENKLPFKIRWFPLGADVNNSAPTRGLPQNAEHMLREFSRRPCFLMVGTIEPRKAYLQVIEAFTELWNEGCDAILVIVGREGWNPLPDVMRRDIPRTVQRIRTHPELNRRLFWLEGISDEYLEQVYAVSRCLIAASYGEGFGLPLIEGARHGLPIIARDIPVFRETAGGNAYFFTAATSQEMAGVIRDWMDQRHHGMAPGSGGMNCVTWAESAEQLIKELLSERSTGQEGLIL